MPLHIPSNWVLLPFEFSNTESVLAVETGEGRSHIFNIFRGALSRVGVDLDMKKGDKVIVIIVIEKLVLIYVYTNFSY